MHSDVDWETEALIDDDTSSGDVILSPVTCIENPNTTGTADLASLTSMASVEPSPTVSPLGLLASTAASTATRPGPRCSAANNSVIRPRAGCSTPSAWSPCRGNVAVDKPAVLAFVKTSGNVFKIVDINQQDVRVERPRPSQVFENTTVIEQRSSALNSKNALRSTFNQRSRTTSSNKWSNTATPATHTSSLNQRMMDAFKCLRIVPYSQYSIGQSSSIANTRKRPAWRPLRRNTSMTATDHRVLLPEATARRENDREAPASTQSENALVDAAADEWELQGQRERLHRDQPRTSRRDLRQPHKVMFKDDQNNSVHVRDEEKVDTYAPKIANRAACRSPPTDTRLARRGGQRDVSNSNVGQVDHATRKEAAVVNLEFVEPEKRNIMTRATDQKLAERLLCEKVNAISATAIVNGREPAGISSRHLLHFATGNRTSQKSISEPRIRVEAKTTQTSDLRRAGTIKTAIGGSAISKTSIGKHQKLSSGTKKSQGARDPIVRTGQHQQPCSTMQAATCDVEPCQPLQLQSCSVPVLGDRMAVCFNVDDSVAACRRTKSAANPSTTIASTMIPSTVASSANTKPTRTFGADGGVPFRHRLPKFKHKLSRTDAVGSRTIATPALIIRRPAARNCSTAAQPTSSLFGGPSRLVASRSMGTTSLRNTVDVIGFRAKLPSKADRPPSVISSETESTKKTAKVTAASRCNNYEPSPIAVDDHRPSASAPDVFRRNSLPASSPRPNVTHLTVSGTTATGGKPKPLLRELLLAHDTFTVQAETRGGRGVLGATNLTATPSIDAVAVGEESSRLKARVEAWIEDVNRCQLRGGGVEVTPRNDTASPRNDGVRRRYGVRGARSLSKPSMYTVAGRVAERAQTDERYEADRVGEAVAARVSAWHVRTISPSSSTVTGTNTRYAAGSPMR